MLPAYSCSNWNLQAWRLGIISTTFLSPNRVCSRFISLHSDESTATAVITYFPEESDPEDIGML
jgi:hypothetical protein